MLIDVDSLHVQLYMYQFAITKKCWVLRHVKCVLAFLCDSASWTWISHQKFQSPFTWHLAVDQFSLQDHILLVRLYYLDCTFELVCLILFCLWWISREILQVSHFSPVISLSGMAIQISFTAACGMQITNLQPCHYCFHILHFLDGSI